MACVLLDFGAQTDRMHAHRAGKASIARLQAPAVQQHALIVLPEVGARRQVLVLLECAPFVHRALSERPQVQLTSLLVLLALEAPTDQLEKYAVAYPALVIEHQTSKVSLNTSSANAFQVHTPPYQHIGKELCLACNVRPQVLCVPKGRCLRC